MEMTSQGLSFTAGCLFIKYWLICDRWMNAKQNRSYLIFFGDLSPTTFSCIPLERALDRLSFSARIFVECLLPQQEGSKFHEKMLSTTFSHFFQWWSGSGRHQAMPHSCSSVHRDWLEKILPPSLPCRVLRVVSNYAPHDCLQMRHRREISKAVSELLSDFTLTRERPMGTSLKFWDLVLAFESWHICWKHFPRSKKTLLPCTASHL